ncbi:MAG: AAA family ATPase [Candidatus Aenigmatarchaeota archaeon]
MLIIGLSGYAASGKSEAAKYLKEKYNFEIFEFSKIIEEEAIKLNLIQENLSLEEKKRKLSEVGKIIREKYGKEEIFALKIIEKIKANKIKKAVVDGIRSLNEIKAFKDEFNKNFYLIFISADAKIRYERRKLQDKNFNLSFEEFLERDKRDIEILGLDKLEEIADFIIENNSSLEEFYKKLDLIISSISD